MPIEVGGRIIGNMYRDGDAAFCVLGDIRPADVSASRADQARSVFEQIEIALRTAGMGPEHLVRTWFFLDRILDWYGEFNAVRSSVFERWKAFDRVLPASTGIGCANAAGAALVADAIAIRPVEVRNVTSPLQCPAMSYRSSFSRAVEVEVPGQQRLYVSGTASIAPDGSSIHSGNLNQQIARSMDVVLEILRSRGMSWFDVTRGVAYFRDVSKSEAFNEYCRAHRLPNLPVAIAAADICRDDLLFEIEVDAVVATR